MTTLSAERLAELETELARWKLQSDDWQKAAYANDARATAAESALAAAREREARLRAMLKEHHAWHVNAGEMAIARDDKGEWISLDMGREYADSSMCDRTLAALTETGHDR